MLRNILSASLVLILVGVSQAAPHGGGRIGGGFHGGARIGGYRGGFQGARMGGFRGGYQIHTGYYQRYRPAIRYGVYARRYPGAYGNALDSGYSYPYYDYYYPTYPDYSNLSYWPATSPGDYDSTPVTGLSPEVEDGSFALATAGAVPHDKAAEVTMTLPANATLWAEGQKIAGNGSTREFHTPELKAGERYAYDFRAKWKEHGHTVTQTQTVIVTPGAHVTVHFPVLPTPAHAAHGF
jgi:uncharacterized protein (TIGR03000 family)